MSNSKGSRLLLFVFVLLFAAVLGSLLSKDRLFDWDHLQPSIQLLFVLGWFMLSLSMLGLITIFIIGKLKFKRERLRIILLCLTIVSCICCLLIEINIYSVFYNLDHCLYGNVDINAKIAYQLPFLPLSIDIDTQGKISLSGDTSISLELGTVTAGADVSQFPVLNNGDHTDNSTTILIIQHRQGDEIVDTTYQLRSVLDSVQIVTTGRTVTQLRKNYYFIDASQGNIESTQINIFPANSNCSAPISS